MMVINLRLQAAGGSNVTDLKGSAGFIRPYLLLQRQRTKVRLRLSGRRFSGSVEGLKRQWNVGLSLADVQRDSKMLAEGVVGVLRF
jgi:hypothetical protein